MALRVIEPAKPPISSATKFYIGQSYVGMLHQLMQDLLASSPETKDADFSDFIDKFYELMQVKIDPPLETFWVYSALKFQTFSSAKTGTSDQIASLKALFQLVSACSAACHPFKSIALLAPLVFKAYDIVLGLWKTGLSSKKEKKMAREIRSLVDVVLGYVSMCCCKDSGQDDGEHCKLIMPLRDLSSLWLNGTENIVESESVRVLFPLVSDEIRGRISGGECDVEELGVVVMAEVFLLKLCLSFKSGISTMELEKDLKSWAVASISGFQNPYFFDVLINILLLPTLPVNTLLSSEDEFILRKVLYDAVIMVDYSFLTPQHAPQLLTERIRTLALLRLIITHEAVELFRRKGDQSKAIAYINAFSSSCLPLQIIKLVASVIGAEAKESAPTGSSPRAYMRWILDLENHGVRVFQDAMSRFQHLLSVDEFNEDHEQARGNIEGTKEFDSFFYIDNKGQVEENKDEHTLDTVNAAFLAAAQSMNETEMGGTRKRKDKLSDKMQKQIKFLRYTLPDVSDQPDEELPRGEHDDSSSGSDVEDQSSDEDKREK